MTVLTKKIGIQEFLQLELPDNSTYFYELINGELVHRNTPSGEHQEVQSNLLEQLIPFILSKKLGKLYTSPTAVVLNEDTVIIPDLVFLKKENRHKFDAEWGIKGAPDLVVEIVSPSSFKLDRFEKRSLYLENGIPEYWIVDPNYRSIEIHSLRDGRYEISAFGVEEESVTSEVLVDFELKVKDVFLK